ncbi:hypothetical protein ACFQGW_04465 [Xanthomonas theicola]|uniref:hypothetical protein n=1 Tax=Xanthomonas theicola TaxID=56464 RepID=UPI0036092678
MSGARLRCTIPPRLARTRRCALWLLLAAFYLLPWLRRDGRQALLFDLPLRAWTCSAGPCGRTTSAGGGWRYAPRPPHWR